MVDIIRLRCPEWQSQIWQRKKIRKKAEDGKAEYGREKKMLSMAKPSMADKRGENAEDGKAEYGRRLTSMSDQ
jgi:hypothetical protein